MGEQQSAFRPLDDDGKTLINSIWQQVDHAGLASLMDEAQPYISRIAICAGPQACFLSLVSDLALHTGAIREHNKCALLLAPPLTPADPLTQPRLSLICRTDFISADHPDFAELSAIYKKAHKMADMLFGFTDFHLVRFEVSQAHLNAGFGKAYRLDGAELLSCLGKLGGA